MAKGDGSVFSGKRLQISRDQKWSFIAIAVIVFSIVFSLSWVTNRYQVLQYNRKVKRELDKDTANLERAIGNIGSLQAAHNQFIAVDNYVLDKNNRSEEVDNSVIVARALPSFYHKLELQSALQTFLKTQGNYDVSFDLPASVEGGSNLAERAEDHPGNLPEPPVDESESEADNENEETESNENEETASTGEDLTRALLDNVVPVKFDITVKDILINCGPTDAEGQRPPCFENFFYDLDLFITPLRVRGLHLEILNPQDPEEIQIADMTVRLETYYLPKPKIDPKDSKKIPLDD